MALPNAIQRRELLYGSEKTDFAAEARRYLAEEEHSDALEFALKIPDAGQRGEVVRELRELAQRQGNWFLLNRMDRAEKVPADVWEKAFSAAKSSGKTHYALKIARKLGDQAAIQALELELGLRRPEPEVSGEGVIEAITQQQAQAEAPSEPAPAGDGSSEDQAAG